VRPTAPGPSSHFAVGAGLFLERDPLIKTRAQLDDDRHAISSSLLPLPCLSLRSESATSSDVVPPPSSGPTGGRPNSICAIVLTCVLDSTSDVQPLPLDFEAFLSDSINLDIISGRSLIPKVCECERQERESRCDRTRGSRCGSFVRKSQAVFVHGCRWLNSQRGEKLK